jgi:anti-sigma B factor antagonist
VALLEIDSRERDGATHLALRGELDLSTVPRLEAELGRAERGAPPLVVLDLSKLSFLDSTGLRCVVTAAERAREQERRLVVVRGPEPVHRVFEITRLEERLEMIDDASSLPAGD